MNTCMMPMEKYEISIDMTADMRGRLHVFIRAIGLILFYIYQGSRRERERTGLRSGTLSL